MKPIHSKQMTLLGEDVARNEASNDVWKRREVDEMLDLYLAGTTPARIATILRRNHKAVTRKLQEYIYNERERSVNYVPKRRTSRKGKRLTENDKQIVTECRKKGVSWEQIAKVLARPVEDIRNDEPTAIEVAHAKGAAAFVSSLDLILAHKCIYHYYEESIISNEAYDDLVKEECELGTGSRDLAKYPDPFKLPYYIRYLALYLLEKYKIANNIPLKTKLPRKV